ncbi:hypothetical protein MJ560_07615 [Klebsiella pneumoniae]|nr:hypothetical protein MJ560_07615 [Klebsiella pneumoniae]
MTLCAVVIILITIAIAWLMMSLLPGAGRCTANRHVSAGLDNPSFATDFRRGLRL